MHLTDMALDLEVNPQGDHSTVVDISSIRKFMQRVIKEGLENILSEDTTGNTSPLDVDTVKNSFFSKGAWIFNVERKQLPGSNHFHPGTLRAYEKTGYGSIRIVVHPKDSEKRYGNLHPPASMSKKEVHHCIAALMSCFSVKQGQESRDMLENAELVVKITGGKTAKFGSETRSVHGISRRVLHAKTILRSREKKISFVQHLHKMTNEGRVSLDYFQMESITRNHWNKFINCKDNGWSEFLGLMMIEVAIAENLLVSLSDNSFRIDKLDEFVDSRFNIGELGEILVQDMLEEEKLAKEREYQDKVQRAEKLVEKLTSDKQKAQQKLEQIKTSLSEAERSLEELKPTS